MNNKLMRVTIAAEMHAWAEKPQLMKEMIQEKLEGCGLRLSEITVCYPKVVETHGSIELRSKFAINPEDAP